MLKIRMLVIFCVCLFPCYAFSATSTTSFTVTATVNASCNVSASSLTFGVFNPILGTNLDVNTTVTVTCTNTTPYNVGLDEGTGAGASVANRLMTSSSLTLAYSLYQNSMRTTVWGNTIGTDTVTGTGNGTDQPLTVYGRIFSSNTGAQPSTSYTDTINVTVTY